MLSAPGHGGAESTSRAPCNALAKDQKRIKEKDLQASFKNKSTSKTRNKSNTQAAKIQFWSDGSQLTKALLSFTYIMWGLLAGPIPWQRTCAES